MKVQPVIIIRTKTPPLPPRKPQLHWDGHKIIIRKGEEIMKKLIILASLLLFLSAPSIAEEVQQTQEATDIKGSILIKKQPTQEGVVQVQKVEKVYGSIVIFCQGKTPWDKTENKTENKTEK